MSLTFGSLFAGIGGFDAGLESAGAECVFQVERDKDCNRILSRHWPRIERHSDVREFSKAETAFRPDLITGGFPCQDLSVAGRRAGLSGERSGLWYEFKRIIGEFSPRWVLIENVPGLLSGCGCPLCCIVAERMRQHAEREREINPMARSCECGECEVGKELHQAHSGRNFAIVMSAMVELGYGVASRVLDAQWFGVPQRRRRVFIVGCLGDFRRAAEVLFERESLPWDSPPSREAGQGTAACFTAGAHPGSHNGQDDHKDGRLIAATLNSGGNDGGFRTEPGEHIVSVRTAQTSANGHGLARDVAHTLDGSQGQAIAFDPRQITSPDNRSNPRPDGPCHTLHEMAHAIAFNHQAGGSKAFMGISSERITALSRTQTPAVAFQTRIVRNGRGQPKEITDALTSADSGRHADSKPHVTTIMGIRRLTPRECERLQGFEDDWTRSDADGKELSDSARYRMLGNAVCRNVAEWLGRRIISAGQRTLIGDDE